jgi:prepilin signal peptidase PulO-like enzyme (type II secretory pathway)
MALGALGGWEPLLLLVLIAIIIGLDLAALLNIYRRSFSKRQKYAWASLVVFLPVVGALMYIIWYVSQHEG